MYFIGDSGGLRPGLLFIGVLACASSRSSIRVSIEGVKAYAICQAVDPGGGGP